MQTKLQDKINFKTKPVGSLGMLEKIALQIGMIQNTLTPKLSNPAIIVFAADHGVANDGVSAFPQEVTYQMVLNFLQGGAAINVFSRRHGIQLSIVDAGVNFDFDGDERLIDCKVAKATNSFIAQPAMSMSQFDECIDYGKAIVKKTAQSGSNIIGFGEMGIGNTATSAIIMSYLCDLPIEQCAGRGTGVDDEQLQNKIAVLQKAKDFHGAIADPQVLCATFGGFEMTQMCGAMLEAFEQGMIILVDGFIASSVFLVAHRINPAIIKNAIFCHLSDEQGHRRILEHLQVQPVLQMGLRLGEGTGCALAYPIIQSAVDFLNDMASFADAGVSEKA